MVLCPMGCGSTSAHAQTAALRQKVTSHFPLDELMLDKVQTRCPAKTKCGVRPVCRDRLAARPRAGANRLSRRHAAHPAATAAPARGRGLNLRFVAMNDSSAPCRSSRDKSDSMLYNAWIARTAPMANSIIRHGAMRFLGEFEPDPDTV